MNTRRRSAVALLMLALGACSADPAVKKQQFLESGNRYVGEGKLDHAIIEFRNAIEVDPSFGEAHARLADAYGQLGDARRALDESVRAADLLPTDLKAQLTAATMLLATGQAEDALARADTALRLDPSSTEAHLLRGNALAGLRSLDDALKAVEEAIRLDPDSSAPYTHLGFVELARGQRDQAEAAFKKAVDLAPDTSAPRLALGNYYWAIGRVAEAEDAFKGALKVEPENISANRAMAAFTIGSGRPAEAEPYLQRLADGAGNTAGVLTLAEYYLMSGRARDAIGRLEPLYKEASARSVGELLARAYLAAGDRTRANETVDKVLASSPSNPIALTLKGQLLVDEGRSDDAFAAVRKAVAANPESVEAQFALGRLYAGRGDGAAAEAAFREVLRLNPRAAIAQTEMARLQLTRGRAEESLKTAEEAARSQPRNINARLTLVRSLLASKNLARAEREVTALRTEYPKVAEVQAQVGMLELRKNNVAGARAAFAAAESLNPRLLEATAGQIALDFKANDLASAKARVEARLKAGATPEVLLLAARTSWSAKDPATAEKYLRQAIEADPALLPPYAMLGQLYMSQRKLDQARAEFDALATKQEKPIAALTMSGIILQTQQNIPLAKERFEQVLRIDGQAAIAANNLAWILADRGEDLDRALQLAQAASGSAPDVPEVLDTLGWVYYKKDLPQLAAPYFQRAAERAPANASYHYHLGLAYTKAGDTAKARAAFEQALEAGPDEATAAEIRKILATR